MVPRSGGVYVFAERTLGRFGGTVVGWSDLLNAVFAIALLAVALAEFTGELVPALRTSTSALAATIVCGFTLLNLHSVRLAAGTQELTSLLKLLALWLLALACLAFAPRAADPPATVHAFAAAHWTAAGAVASFQLVLGAFNGWAAPAYFGGETRGGWRSAPKAMLYGGLLVATTYLLINVSLFQVVPLSELAGSKLPAAAALERLTSAHGWSHGLGATLCIAVAVASLPSTLQAVMMQTSRTLHAMSVDGLFWRWGASVNRRGAPANAVLACGTIALLLATTSSFETLFITFTVFAVANNLILLCGVVRLRRLEPDLHRPFKVIGYPWSLVPIVIIDLMVFVGFASANLRQCVFSAALVAAAYIAYRFHRRGGVRA